MIARPLPPPAHGLPQSASMPVARIPCPAEHRDSAIRAIREALIALAAEATRLADALEHELQRPRTALLVRTAGALLSRAAKA